MKLIKVLPWIPLIGIPLTVMYWDEVGMNDYANKLEYYGSAVWQAVTIATIFFLMIV